MPKPYGSHGSRSRTDAIALSGIADGIAALQIEEGPTKVGGIVGEAKTTVHGWHADLHRWSLYAGLILGRNVPSIGARMTAFLNGTEVAPASPTAAVSEAYETATRASSLISEIVGSVQDGKIDRAEGRRLVSKIESLAAILPELERDVKAAAVAR